MTARSAGAVTVPRRGAYFFLSYAHSAPAPGESADTDRWVRVCYEDLTERVRQIARPAAGLSAGFIDDLILAESDWNAALGDALAVSEVFVALYSPGYFNKSWPLREREAFARRLREIEGSTDKHRHILPVLWLPVFSWQVTPDIQEAVQLGVDVPAYVDNGLRALCMLPSYREEYETILERIARRIVDVAENSPVGPSWAPPPEDLPGTAPTATQFVVAVAAPDADGLPTGRNPTTYGPDAQGWRPFGGSGASPLAQYVAHTAERLGLPSRTTALAGDPQAAGRSAALVLIDPWVAADPAGRAALTAMVRALPDWALCVVVANRSDEQYRTGGADLARQVAEAAGGPAPLPVMAVDDLQQFIDGVPVLVTEARRRYLLLGPAFTPKDFTIDGSGDQRLTLPTQHRKNDT
ncbi:MAG TPA: TIR-like protein FxsC, partial [Actinoplanes sp.]|jgi:FxsC-like protein